MSRFETLIRKRAAVNAAEKAGEVADSMDVRRELLDRVHAGEITIQQAQQELRQIQRNAKAAGKVTRSQAFTRG